MPPLIRLAAVSKSYGGVPALAEADLTCDPGLVHAILGENGAGKSTLMKLLAGVIQPNSGVIELDGQPISFASPRDAARRGIICMFQELSLMPHLSVGDNMALASPGTGKGLVGRAAYRLARATLDRVGASHISTSSLVGDLSLADRQLVEIAKAIVRKPRLLILDEATSALTSGVVQIVFRVIRELKAAGVAVLFISHRMHEVDAVADRISVFRNGRHIETFPAGTRSHEQIVGLMIGQSLKELFPPRGAPVAQPIEPLLKLRNVSWSGQLASVDLDVRPGEIVGLGGLDGQGQQQVMHAIFGVLNRVEGDISISGRPLGVAAPSDAKKPNVGIALVPEDRKTEGLVLEMSIADNLKLASLGRLPLGLLASQSAVQQRLSALIQRLALTFGKLSDPVGSLSGGNQQKVVLAKWLALSPKCLLLMDPTRGIDVKTKSQIYQLLRELAAEGMAIVLQSTDYEELIHLCDRVYVFYRGRVNRELAGDNLTADALIAASMNLSAAAELAT